MVPEKYDLETDVVVVGYGAAGATSAITAHDNGAGVIILEKMPEPGGNTRVSGANITVPENAEDYTRYLETICFKTLGRDIIDVFVQGSMENVEWIRKLGGDVQRFAWPQVSYSYNSPDITFPTVPGGERMARYSVKGSQGTGGYRMFQLLSGNVQRRGIKVLLSTRAKELIRNAKGEVTGVTAEAQGKSISIKAKNGVIMTCGGFENDNELKWDYLPCRPIHFVGNPGNTGDGIRMVQKIGAALWHMHGLAAGFGLRAEGVQAAMLMNYLAPGFIYVDRDGKRFANENGIDSHESWKVTSYFDSKRFIYPRIPCYAILDEELIRRGPVVKSSSGYCLLEYKWSPDNSAELKKGWIVKAKNTGELAKKIGADAATLENTITRYNEYCKAGRDADFGRAKEALKAIEAPYYAVQLWPSLLNTQGGPRRDKEARVLDPYGKPIPRLYAAGEFGSIWGFLYQTATNMAECLIFGRIAGRNAAMSQPLE